MLRAPLLTDPGTGDENQSERANYADNYRPGRQGAAFVHVAQSETDGAASNRDTLMALSAFECANGQVGSLGNKFGKYPAKLAKIDEMIFHTKYTVRIAFSAS